MTYKTIRIADQRDRDTRKVEPVPLLILSCSATKRGLPGLMPAVYRYDGPAYRVLRASGWPGSDGPHVRVVILSAYHGPLDPFTPIEDYDVKMDGDRAQVLSQFWPLGKRLLGLLDHPTSEVFVFGGALYREVIQAWGAAGPFEHVPGEVAYSDGGIGTQLGQLTRWLEARNAAFRLED